MTHHRRASIRLKLLSLSACAALAFCGSSLRADPAANIFPLSNASPLPDASTDGVLFKLFGKTDPAYSAPFASLEDLGKKISNNNTYEASALDEQRILLAGLTEDPNYKQSSPSIFGSLNNLYSPNLMYSRLQNMAKQSQFLSTDVLYNPAKTDPSINAILSDPNSVKNLDFNSFLQGDAAHAQTFLSVLVNPSVTPASLQNYIFNQYQNHQTNFKAKVDSQLLYPGGIKAGNLATNFKAYQAQRRKYLAIQSVAVTNLQTLLAMNETNSKNPVSTDSIRRLVMTNAGNWKNSATPITVERLNLLTNLLIADEMSKQRQVNQRMLATLSIMLLQNNAASTSMLKMEYGKTTKQIDQLFGIDDKSN